MHARREAAATGFYYGNSEQAGKVLAIRKAEANPFGRNVVHWESRERCTIYRGRS